MDTDERYEVVAWQERCVRRGHWQIEGFDVLRASPDAGPWTVSKKFATPHQVATLEQARAWIAARA